MSSGDSLDRYDHLENQLMSQNVYITAIGEVDDTLEIVYETVALGDGIPPRQIGSVVRVLQELDDWEPQDVGATVTTTDGLVRGTWEVREEWFRKLDRDEMSETEFSRRAIESIVSH